MIHCSVEQTESFIRYLRNTALKDTKIDSVIAIARGGLIPGVYASHYFNLPLHVIDLKSYDNSNQRGLIEWVVTVDPVKVGSTVLVVDDVCDSGATFQEVDSFFKKHNIKAHFAAVAKKTHTEFNCIYKELVDTHEWIKFQWEME